MRKWIGLAVAVACILLLVLLGVSMARGIVGILNGAGTSGEPDPMFAQPASVFTRPPELLEEPDAARDEPDDPSAAWVYEETSPVDQTAEELAAEQGAAES